MVTMLRIRTLPASLVLLTLLVCVFLMGRTSASQLRQALPGERPAAYQFPKSWGELRTVVGTSRGLAYFFVAADGTIRHVHVGPGGPEDIEVIAR
jgi:hypothetical protein